jgi:hypothetical protein
MRRTALFRAIVASLLCIATAGSQFAGGHTFVPGDKPQQGNGLLASALADTQPAVMRTERIENGRKAADLRVSARYFCPATQHTAAGHTGHLDIGISFVDIGNSTSCHTLFSLHSLLIV